MGTVGKRLQSFELFVKSGVVTEFGEILSDDEFGCLWSSITLNDEVIPDVNCGQLLANKLRLAAERKEHIDLSFVRYNNGEKNFNSIAAIRTSMGVIPDVEFAAEQLIAGAAKMRRYGWIGVAVSLALIASLVIAVLGVALLVPSIILLVRARRPLRFAEVLRTAARAL